MFYCYRWLSGERRPGQIYVIRMAQLLLMKLEGTDFRLIETIDWSTGATVQKGGIPGKPLKGTVKAQALAKFLDLTPKM